MNPCPSCPTTFSCRVGGFCTEEVIKQGRLWVKPTKTALEFGERSVDVLVICTHGVPREQCGSCHTQPVASAPAPYVDKTGTDQKPNPMRDVFQEFPLAMAEVAKVTAFGARKHAPRGWQTFDPDYGIAYHTSKLGRHLLGEETDGPVNHSDGDLLHAAQVAWNSFARLEHMLRKRAGAVPAK